MRPAAYPPGYRKKDRTLLTVAVIFMVFAALFFSYSMINYLNSQDGEGPSPGGVEPRDGDDGTIGNQIVSAKKSLEGINRDLDELSALL